MPNPEQESIYEIILCSIRDFKMFGFMCSILILLILSSVLEGYQYAYLILNAISTIVIIAGVYAASANKKSVIILLVLALPWFFSEWFFMKSTNTVFLSFFFFLYVTLTLFDMIIKSKEITQNTLYGAVCVYLLLGLLWASIYGLIDRLIPGAIFSGDYIDSHLTSNEVIYFSYTTLTTLGYGDITSIAPVGRIMSVLEAIIGQLFIAFMVARLIGIYSSKATFKEY
ncbi:MAG: ion channel [Thermodesulfobacteriota bacterium]